jgi:hypothetical protein
MRSKVKRKPRRIRHHEAWIFLGEQRRHCTVLDTSADGAKLTLSGPEALPKEFLLGFSRQIDEARRCQLAWQRGNTVGVTFMP